jgi:DNA-binding LytR/AlgR family response regulator
MKVMIVDDEPLAHRVLLHHLTEFTDIEVVKQCYNASEALSYLAKQQVDLMFLDINMPALSGLDMLRVMATPPQVVMVTAYQEYAIDGFELDVTDYLLKPVSPQRLQQAIEKVRARRSVSIVEPANQHIFVKVEREKRKLTIKHIRYLEAYGNYVKVWLEDEMVLANSTLKSLLTELPQGTFLQIHKSFVINIEHVQSIDTDTVTLAGGCAVKIGKSYKREVKASLVQ